MLCVVAEVEADVVGVVVVVVIVAAHHPLRLTELKNRSAMTSSLVNEGFLWNFFPSTMMISALICCHWHSLSLSLASVRVCVCV